MTSSILPPRNDFAPCSPSTQAIASTTLDLPEPFGPTTQVIPGSKRRVVEDAKDLKPRSVRLFRCTGGAPRSRRQGKAGPNVADAGRGGRQPGDSMDRFERTRDADMERAPAGRWAP